MLTSKQRARLRAMANTLSDTVLIGKEGLTDAVIAQVEEVLEKHELMKIKILETAMLTPREAQQVLCEELDAEPVQCIGTKVVIFRVARQPENRHIDLNA
ncbi:YhbY family RNA-binding protein [Butyricicoccus porcorum]|uniref:RNA-binding protein n=1 Tax=Butyricicoccus porcorum TaxID=1945634 RepID=A0A252F7K4_9FIRM|nr:YhbY family RNA-binding protein [Butyricicoccus porcorum]MCI6927511.1 YhbY family RNA-binding protein [Butyricicoccus porcorum]MDD6986249.1 YhbY family RNA-binding protein [Butyricicoccus porcorum]MDY4483009.1 YhbY family RNA-binding protein [Butyricicoccus porcorum]OUM21702.1 RNA-binding protein [Butyricicoccus porcorum]